MAQDRKDQPSKNYKLSFHLDNKASPEIINAICKTILATPVKELNLQGSHFTEKQLKQILSAAKQNPAIQTYNFNDCKFTVTAFKFFSTDCFGEIPDQVKNSFVRVLKLERTITTKMDSLAKNLPGIRELSFSPPGFNDLKEEENYWKTLAAIVEKNPQLLTLGLVNLQLTDNNLPLLKNLIPHLQNIETLLLSSLAVVAQPGANENKFVARAMQVLCELVSLPNLRCIDLSYFGILANDDISYHAQLFAAIRSAPKLECVIFSPFVDHPDFEPIVDEEKKALAEMAAQRSAPVIAEMRSVLDYNLPPVLLDIIAKYLGPEKEILVASRPADFEERFQSYLAPKIDDLQLSSIPKESKIDFMQLRVCTSQYELFNTLRNIVVTLKKENPAGIDELYNLVQQSAVKIYEVPDNVYDLLQQTLHTICEMKPKNEKVAELLQEVIEVNNRCKFVPRIKGR